MRKIQIVFIFAACLFFVTSTVTAQKAKNTVTNADVVEMVKAGLPESTIVLAIQQSEPNFDTSVKALIELKNQGVSQKIMDAMLQPQTTTTKTESPKRADPGNAIAWKDIGSLRVVLKTIMRVNLSNGGSGIRCNFEFINLETQKPIVVALNAIALPQGNVGRMGSELRSTLVDESGGLWNLRNEDVAGMNIIGVGNQSYGGSNYDPAEIGVTLSKRDDLNSNCAGTQYREFCFLYGSMTEMAPGQSLTVTMTFTQYNNQTNSGTLSKVFQMGTEIVVGVLTSGSKKSYTLYNLTFDRVSSR